MWGTGVVTSWLSRRHGNVNVGMKLGVAVEAEDSEILNPSNSVQF